MFEVSEETIETPALTLRHHLTPWDQPILGAPAAAISAIELRDPAGAATDYAAFRQWCDRHGVVLVSCRLAQQRLVECGFLEAQGFRFIELNFRPETTGLRQMDLGPEDDIAVAVAAPGDAAAISAIAGRIYEAGRFHQDPLLGPAIGNRRYRIWAENAFRAPHQEVLKCLRGGQLVGFFVVERPAPDHRFWSLVGLAPGLAGQGLGRRVWRAVLRHHRGEGVDRVSTSISSHNLPAHNLYVSLGFRFPPPDVTLHWCPRGKVTAP